MNTMSKPSSLLGIAFLFQAVMPMIGQSIQRRILIVPGDIVKSMHNIASHPGLMYLNIMCEMLTAAGIIFLGALLFLTLRKWNEKMALTGLGLYILEAVLLSVSRVHAFTLLQISREFEASGNADYLLTMGKVAFGAMNYSYTMLMIAFCLGAIPFYYLLFQSRLIPGALSLYGLITVICPCLIASVLVMFGFPVPFYVYLPYGPFEPVVGIWILVNGVHN